MQIKDKVMEKKVFKCKQFEIDDTRSALKIGSDGMMLGAWIDASLANTILDIGSGSGLIALMQAQKYPKAQILGVDIHEGSVLDALENAKRTPWKERLNFIVEDIKQYKPTIKFDYIVTNPPFFVNSTKSKSKALSNAKHTDNLSPEEIIDLGLELLSENGVLAMILPYDLGNEVVNYAKSKDYFLKRSRTIFPVSYKKPNRLLFELTRNTKEVVNIEEPLFVRDSTQNNAFSQGYKNLLYDFMLRY